MIESSQQPSFKKNAKFIPESMPTKSIKDADQLLMNKKGKNNNIQKDKVTNTHPELDQI